MSNGKLQLPAGMPVRDHLHARGCEHPFGCPVRRGSIVLVTVIYDRPDPRLDQRLRALIAGKQRHIELGAFQTAAPVI